MAFHDRNCGSNYENRGDAEWQSEDCSREDREFTIGDAARDALEAAIGRAFHMRVLKGVAQLVQSFPRLPLLLTENRISISRTAPDGFPMSVETERGRYVVRFAEWSDELVLASEVIELLEAALCGRIRVRVDMDIYGTHWRAERLVPTGEWITMPRHEDAMDEAAVSEPIRSHFLRNGAALF